MTCVPPSSLEQVPSVTLQRQISFGFARCLQYAESQQVPRFIVYKVKILESHSRK